MQICVPLAAILCAVPAAALSLSASAAAEVWLHVHRGAPQADELAELKTTNPEAYGLVKALLTKRSLGLLDPKHPSASFAAAAHSGSSAEAEDVGSSGPAVFERIAEESGEKPKAALLYPEAAQPSAHHDWLNWKPQQGALDDESMVKNVLGAVAALKGGGRAADASESSVTAEAPRAAAALSTKSSTVATMGSAGAETENSYLKGIDFGLSAQPAVMRTRTSAEENSYLKGIDLTSASSSATGSVGGSGARTLGTHGRNRAAVGLSSVSKSESSSVNYLASFSWDDNVPHQGARRKQPDAEEASGAAPTQKAVSGGHQKKDALLAWLSPTTAPTAKQVTPAPAEQNSYLKDLDLN